MRGEALAHLIKSTFRNDGLGPLVTFCVSGERHLPWSGRAGKIIDRGSDSLDRLAHIIEILLGAVLELHADDHSRNVCRNFLSCRRGVCLRVPA